MADDITLDAPETRIERFLAAAAGVEGITLDEPETRIEKYLYKIAQGSGGVPAVEDADKGKFLHANESTGDLEWAAAGGGGGGGAFFVHVDSGTGALDKTWKEIWDASRESVVILQDESLNDYMRDITQYTVRFAEVGLNGSIENMIFSTDSENGYPVIE